MTVKKLIAQLSKIPGHYKVEVLLSEIPLPACGLCPRPFISVNGNPDNGLNGPNIYITGANLHILSGAGSTNTTNNGAARELGNLIIGYNEIVPGTTLPPMARTGTHNLVVGRFNQFIGDTSGNILSKRLPAFSSPT
jgi:hypothetical protein